MTSAAFASLSAPLLEDSMELSSSPAGDQFEDIDIDLGDYHTDLVTAEDERMLDDGEQARPTTSTDDMMDDEDYNLLAPGNEEEMHDEPISSEAVAPGDPEDELIDYDDENDQDQTALNANDTAQDILSNGFAVPADAQVIEEPVDEENLRKPEHNAPQETNNNVVEEVDEIENIEPGSHVEPVALSKPADTKSEKAAPVQHPVETAQVADVLVEETAELTANEEPSVAEPEEENLRDQYSASKPPPHLPGILDTSLDPVADGPPTPTDTGLHPMTIKYGEHEMPLFKSRAQPAGLLKDDNLANVSLADLIRSCRKRLSIKLGEGSVPEGQDLVLNFKRLGIMLFEGSRSASSTSLNDIVEVYQALHANDGNDEAPPLLLSLQPQPFSTMLEGFKRAAAAGIGFSNFVQPTDDGEYVQDEHTEQLAHEKVDYYDEEVGDSAAPEETYYDGEAANGHDGPNEEIFGSDFSEQRDDHEYQEGKEGSVQPPDQLHEDGENPDDGNAEFPQGEYPGPEDDLSQFDEDNETYNDAPDDVEINEKQADEYGDTHEFVQPKSTASSDTIHGDVANERTDDVAGDVHDDSPSFVVEGNMEHGQDASAVSRNTEQDEYDKPANQRTSGEDENLARANSSDHAAHQAEAEDFLNEEFLQRVEDGSDPTADHETYFDDNAGVDLLGFAEEEIGVQTDNIEQPQEDFDPDEEPEQYHTALDVLAGTDGAYDHNPAAETVDLPNDEEFDDEDDIGYDDDDAAEAAPGVPNSPLGKRSFEEHVTEDDFDFDEPDPKKPRSG